MGPNQVGIGSNRAKAAEFFKAPGRTIREGGGTEKTPSFASSRPWPQPWIPGVPIDPWPPWPATGENVSYFLKKPTFSLVRASSNTPSLSHGRVDMQKAKSCRNWINVCLAMEEGGRVAGGFS